MSGPDALDILRDLARVADRIAMADPKTQAAILAADAAYRGIWDETFARLRSEAFPGLSGDKQMAEISASLAASEPATTSAG